MAKARKTGKGAPKKKWVKIVAPKLFNQQVIGEISLYDQRDGIGRNVKVNMMSLTKNPKQQGTNVSFAITGQHEDKLTSEFTGLRIMPPIVRRMARRGKNKIELSIVCRTSDGKSVRVKPVLVTRMKAKGSALTAIRKSAEMFLKSSFSKSAYDKISEEIISYRLQKALSSSISKIMPLSKCEIRWLQLLKEEKPAAAKAEVQEKPKAEAKA